MKKLLSIVKPRSFNIFSFTFIVLAMLFIGNYNSTQADAEDYFVTCGLTVNTCIYGTYSSAPETQFDYYRWKCNGSDGGGVFCYAKKPVALLAPPTSSGSLPMTCGGDYYYLTYYPNNEIKDLYKKVNNAGTAIKLNTTNGFLNYKTATCCAGSFYWNEGMIQRKIASGGTVPNNLSGAISEVSPTCVGNNLFWLNRGGVYSDFIALYKSIGSAINYFSIGTAMNSYNTLIQTCSLRGDNKAYWITDHKVCNSPQNNPSYKCFDSQDPVIGECKPGEKCNFVNDCYYCDAGTAPNENGDCLPPTSDLSVSIVGGSAAGTVVSNPSGINCGSTCNYTYSTGATVSLNVTAGTGYTFSGWSGDCNASGQVTMNSAKTCTATFTRDTPVVQNSYNLTVNKAGTGNGVTIGDGPYYSGTIVTLVAIPSSGSTFIGWSGDCSTTGQVTMNSAKTCTATFTLDVQVPTTALLTVQKAGTGTGSIGSGISCGSACTNSSLSFNINTSVILTASPSSGSTFTGWSGDCNASGQVTMTGAKTCIANFNLDAPIILTVVTTGNGLGTVTGPSINCGATCSSIYAANTVVNLIATANTGSTFTGWSGECNTNGQVTMSGVKTCVANFTLNNQVATTTNLTILKAGTGTGTISGPAISCGATCPYVSISVATGTAITLTNTPSTGSTFSGWSGDCSTTGQVTMNSAKTCTATFTLDAPASAVLLNVYKSGSGTITGSGINCGSTCAATYTANTVVSLAANPGTGYTFSGWTGDCSASGQVAMSSNKVCIANFTAATPSATTATLSAFASGTGTGNITGAGTYYSGTLVTLIATPSANSIFSGWSGDCNARGQVTVSSNKTCVATFTYGSSGPVTPPQGNADASICQFIEILININVIAPDKVSIVRQMLGCTNTYIPTVVREL